MPIPRHGKGGWDAQKAHYSTHRHRHVNTFQAVTDEHGGLLWVTGAVAWATHDLTASLGASFENLLGKIAEQSAGVSELHALGRACSTRATASSVDRGAAAAGGDSTKPSAPGSVACASAVVTVFFVPKRSASASQPIELHRCAYSPSSGRGYQHSRSEH